PPPLPTLFPYTTLFRSQLLPTARQLAADIAGNDQESARELLASYKRIAATTVGDGIDIEQQTARGWQGRKFDPAEIERRRAAIVDRKSTRLNSSHRTIS